jgi:hypothetical protein
MTTKLTVKLQANVEKAGSIRLFYCLKSNNYRLKGWVSNQ